MQYKDLNLKKIRDDNGLDFAHFTYQRGMCSCCYGPLDLPKRYWRGGSKPVNIEGRYYELNGRKVNSDDIQFILFKNANNGSGTVKKDDVIKSYQCIEWNFPLDKMEKICKDLQEQVGNEYVVMMPPSKTYCIIVIKNNDVERIDSHMDCGYKNILGV